MPLTIRQADVRDAEIVVEFNALLAKESEEKTLDRELLYEGVLAGLADENKSVYFLACDSDSVLGQMMYTREWSDWRNGWFWWIQSVYVRPEARQRGVFRALFQHILDAAKNDPEVIGVRLYVEKDNHAARATYERVGMSETGYLVLERYPL